MVDDDPGIRSSLEKLLTTAGHAVTLAENGVEATRRWRELGADLIILDIFMPEMDGLETLAALLANAPRLPVIAMSDGGAGGMQLLPEAKLLGAAHTIEKPFTVGAMMRLVDTALADSQEAHA